MARVLVVDDSAVARLMSRRALEPAGHCVSEAASVAEAWGILTAPSLPTAVDVVLLDWNMPGGNGLELAQLMQGLPELALIPVVFVTSDADLIHQSYAYDSGARGYVVKPFSPSDLLAAVDRALSA